MRLNSQPSHLRVAIVAAMASTGCGSQIWRSRHRRVTPSRRTTDTAQDIVSFLPGMTTSQFSRSVDPSALLRGRATKPMGWSLRQLRRSSRRRPSAMPAISLVRRGLRGAAGGSRRVGRAGSERASAAVVATVPVAVLPATAAARLLSLARGRAQYWAQRWHSTSPRAHLDGSAWAVFGRRPWTKPARYVLGSRMVTNCFA